MIFEINTGAISRGYRRTPYPHRALLTYLHDHGGRVTLSTDSHRADTVDFGLDLAADLARQTGFTAVSYFDGRNFLDTPL